MNYPKFIIPLIIFIAVLSTAGLVVSFLQEVNLQDVRLPLGGLTSINSRGQSSSGGGLTSTHPVFITVSAEPQKVKVGDILTITAEIQDKHGISKVTALMPHENGVDEIELMGFDPSQPKPQTYIYQAQWKCHDTINIEYITTITATNILGKTATKQVSWWDDTETVWYDQNYSLRKKISIDPVTPEIDYQVKVDLTTTLMGDPYANVKANGDDIRFCEADGTLLDYWIETWNASGDSTLWVEVAAQNTSVIYMYYNNPSASSGSSLANTFASGSFTDTFADYAKVNAQESSNINVSGGEVSIEPTLQVLEAIDDASLSSILKSGNNYIIASVQFFIDTAEDSYASWTPKLVVASKTLGQDRAAVEAHCDLKGEPGIASYGYYRINGGAWIEIGRTYNSTYTHKQKDIGDLVLGDLVEFGLAAGGVTIYGKNWELKEDIYLTGNATSNAIASNPAVLSFFKHLKLKISNGGSTHATPVQMEIYGNADSYVSPLHSTKFTIDPNDPIIRLKRNNDTITASSDSQTTWTMTSASGMASGYATILAEEIGVQEVQIVELANDGVNYEHLTPGDDYSVDYTTRTATTIILTSGAGITSGTSKLRIIWVADVYDVDAGTHNTALKLKLYLNRTSTDEASPQIQLLTGESDKYVEMSYHSTGNNYTLSGLVISKSIPEDTSQRVAVGTQLSWSDTESGETTDVKYQLQYYDGSWSLIPEGDLTGNSAGFDTSPIDISSVKTDYGQIRLKANLSTTDTAVTPSIQDWTVTYYYRKYASPEPTATVSSDQEKRPHAPGTSPSGGGVMMF
ncbi:DUF2341 domain-containing protein [Candidatus Parcubacteria bacterium]|nr:DUF2341 domain-containing protein [Candidatus Parcubacteria bacterium]